MLDALAVPIFFHQFHQCTVNVLFNKTVENARYSCILSAIPDPKCQYPVPDPGQDAN